MARRERAARPGLGRNERWCGDDGLCWHQRLGRYHGHGRFGQHRRHRRRATGTAGTTGSAGTGGSIGSAGTGGSATGGSGGSTGTGGGGAGRGGTAGGAAGRGGGGGSAGAGGSTGTGGGAGATGSGGTGGGGTCPVIADFMTAWPTGKGPADIGPKAVSNFKSYLGGMLPITSNTYGGAGYALAFTWFGALRFSKFDGDTTNNTYFITQFEPYATRLGDRRQRDERDGRLARVRRSAARDLPAEHGRALQDDRPRARGRAVGEPDQRHHEGRALLGRRHVHDHRAAGRSVPGHQGPEVPDARGDDDAQLPGDAAADGRPLLAHDDVEGVLGPRERLGGGRGCRAAGRSARRNPARHGDGRLQEAAGRPAAAAGERRHRRRHVAPGAGREHGKPGELVHGDVHVRADDGAQERLDLRSELLDGRAPRLAGGRQQDQRPGPAGPRLPRHRRGARRDARVAAAVLHVDHARLERSARPGAAAVGCRTRCCAPTAPACADRAPRASRRDQRSQPSPYIPPRDASMLRRFHRGRRRTPLRCFRPSKGGSHESIACSGDPRIHRIGRRTDPRRLLGPDPGRHRQHHIE